MSDKYELINSLRAMTKDAQEKKHIAELQQFLECAKYQAGWGRDSYTIRLNPEDIRAFKRPSKALAPVVKTLKKMGFKVSLKFESGFSRNYNHRMIIKW